jgi:hypothetical protein
VSQGCRQSQKDNRPMKFASHVLAFLTATTISILTVGATIA